MKKTLPVLLLFITLAAFADEIPDMPMGSSPEYGDEDEYYDFESTEGITVYGEFPAESMEAVILARINGFSRDREQFIKEDLLRNAGFQRNANARFRPTTGEEKFVSVMNGLFHTIFFFIPIPEKPFAEVEYARLPRGEFYHFESVIYASPLNDVSPEVRTAMELEYMLQVEFCNGALIQNWNENYYTENNIARFEALAESLPASPASIGKLKNRYLNEDLPRIKAARERFKNPTENDARVMQNLSESPFVSP